MSGRQATRGSVQVSLTTVWVGGSRRQSRQSEGQQRAHEGPDWEGHYCPVQGRVPPPSYRQTGLKEAKAGSRPTPSSIYSDEASIVAVWVISHPGGPRILFPWGKPSFSGGLTAFPTQ